LDVDSYINHSTKEDALKRIFHSDDYYSIDRDVRVMLDLPEPRTEKKPRKQAIREQAAL
jgi:hypothetical protein